MVRVLLIADDLTGALDSAVAFAERGMRVFVALSPAQLGSVLQEQADVIAVSTSSREMRAAEAQAAMEVVCEAIGGFSGIVMKKVDSRLKGPIDAELRVLQQRRPGTVFASPAVPRLGRVVVAGKVAGAGVDTPIDVRGAVGSPAAIPDVRTAADLDEALPADLEGTLLVGAAGLAEALARRLVPAVPRPANVVLHRPALLAIGSRDPVTLAQVAMLDGAAVHRAPNGSVPSVLPAPLTVVQMVGGAEAIDARDAAAVFAEGVARMVAGHPPATLFACGGESANAVLTRLGVGVLEIEGEILPGVPVSRAQDGVAGLAVVTKSGGFGAPDTLVRLSDLIVDPDVAVPAAITAAGRPFV